MGFLKGRCIEQEHLDGKNIHMKCWDYQDSIMSLNEIEMILNYQDCMMWLKFLKLPLKGYSNLNMRLLISDPVLV